MLPLVGAMRNEDLGGPTGPRSGLLPLVGAMRNHPVRAAAAIIHSCCPS